MARARECRWRYSARIERSKCDLPAPVGPYSRTGDACCNPRALICAAAYAYSLHLPTTNDASVGSPPIRRGTGCAGARAAAFAAALRAVGSNRFIRQERRLLQYSRRSIHEADGIFNSRHQLLCWSFELDRLRRAIRNLKLLLVDRRIADRRRRAVNLDFKLNRNLAACKQLHAFGDIASEVAAQTVADEDCVGQHDKSPLLTARISCVGRTTERSDHARCVPTTMPAIPPYPANRP